MSGKYTGLPIHCNVFRVFTVKPTCGLINGNYQVVVVQMPKTDSRESLYAERWTIAFDGFEENSVTYINNARVIHNLSKYAHAHICIDMPPWTGAYTKRDFKGPPKISGKFRNNILIKHLVYV